MGFPWPVMRSDQSSERAAAGAKRSNPESLLVVTADISATPLSFPSSPSPVTSSTGGGVESSALPLWEYSGDELAAATGRFHDILSEEKMRLVCRDLRARRFLQDRNVVRLHGYGFCVRYRKLHLVYDYMPHGSLSQHLFAGAGSSAAILSWDRRSKIIAGAARGLHHFHSHGAVHGCVTASNILIDNDFTARLGDFGYSWSRRFRRRCTSPAPTGDIVRMSSETDVLCFGAVVLEVVSGRRSDLDDSGGGDGDRRRFRSLVEWVWALHEAGRILEAADATLGIAAGDDGGCGGGRRRDAVEAKKMLLVGLACSHPDPKQRPKIRDVVEILKSDGVQPPKEGLGDDWQVGDAGRGGCCCCLLRSGLRGCDARDGRCSRDDDRDASGAATNLIGDDAGACSVLGGVGDQDGEVNELEEAVRTLVPPCPGRYRGLRREPAPA
ncbi:Os12g0500400 [Oryza sativa Japonica Group]|uniref:Os12g0500400 protein n=1 Tax=Oryza sativa subsp. japonica TaxID=39947 RepID=Q0IN79_ORYSJ|nr:Os12g0500400 [Oryza sativa Japonica Group]|eukprot:NP_001066817.2 Os12g0500400 [Oryza sativa Japonica Group]